MSDCVRWPGADGPGRELRAQSDEEGAQEDLAGFRSWSGGATARFASAQAGIIRSLVGQVAELVGGDLPDGPNASQHEAGQHEAGQQEPSLAALSAMLGLSDSTELPDDPILARLLPDAYSDDPKAAAEFRRYTEQDLRSGKVAAARTVLATLPASGGRVRLSETESQAWLRALNDVRLALGVRLEVTDDFDQEAANLSADDPRSAYVWVYQWLAYLQDSLISALS
jgi:hypothetical protein